MIPTMVFALPRSAPYFSIPALPSSRHRWSNLPLSYLCLLVFMALIQLSSASCPNMCSGHGTCGAGSVCTCFSGWGYSADCSLRTCPSGPAWADKAYDTDSAHSQTECRYADK